jgi:hypothetical protein
MDTRHMGHETDLLRNVGVHEVQNTCLQLVAIVF